MPRLSAALILALACLPMTASASQYRDLCVSAPCACEYTGPDAPEFGGLVCRDATGLVTAKGSAPCPTGATTYTLSHGETVDLLTGEVAGYMPLGWACSHPGVCLAGAAPVASAAVAICCEWGACVPIVEVLCNGPDSIAYMCDDGVSNLDGTITCFEGEEF